MVYLMSAPSLATEQGTLFDYDLNIYHLEDKRILNPDLIDPNPEEEHNYIYEYSDQWYVDIYEYLDRDQVHVAGPFKITAQQRDLLHLGLDGYFTDDDSWYGMWGFLEDYKDSLTFDLLEILNALPKYKEEVLF